MACKSFFILLVFIVTILTPLTGTVKAQVGTGGKVEATKGKTGILKGSVKAVNGTMIELSGGGPPIDISGIQFVYAPDASLAFPISEIRVGTFISRAGVVFQEGQPFVVARDIAIAAPDTTIIIGRIQSIDTSSQFSVVQSLVVLNQQILITPSTVFLEKKQFNKPPAPLKVGKLVKIVAQTSGSDVVAVVIILDRSLIDLDDEEDEDMDE